MKELTVTEIFSVAPPRTSTLLCLPAKDGGTDVLALPWFTWLNTKHNPMLCFSLPAKDETGNGLAAEQTLYLGFLEAEKARAYEAPMHLPAGEAAAPLPVAFPEGTRACIRCTLFRKFKYPCQQVRLFNCNFEKAYLLKEDE